MRKTPLFATSVVNLLGLNFRCQVERTPGSLDCIDCLVTRLFGKNLPVPIGLFICREQSSKPAFPLWLSRRSGHFDRSCSVIFVSVADSLRENLAASAIFRMIVQRAKSFGIQEFRVLRVLKSGKSEFVEPGEYLAELATRLHKQKRERRKGRVVLGEQGQLLVRASHSLFGVSALSLGKEYMLGHGRLHPRTRVSFLPIETDGVLEAGKIHLLRNPSRTSRRRLCA